LNALRLASSALLICAGCASGPAPPPAGTDAPKPGGAPVRLVLVEVEGSGSETDPFVSRFLSSLSARGFGGVVDARLAGGTLATLRDATSGAAGRFRDLYPGDAYVGVTIPPCYAVRIRSGMADVECVATVRVLSPSGASLGEFQAKGENATGLGTSAEQGPDVEALRDAAEKAAKKLAAVLKR
jgi:hypothetical protein